MPAVIYWRKSFCLLNYLVFQGEYATRLRDLVESGDEKIRDRLFIDVNPEKRRGRIKFDDTIFKGTLYELPCITESYKTFDRKTLYKIADVAQV
jgi:transcription initiation factor TFIID subunit 7